MRSSSARCTTRYGHVYTRRLGRNTRDNLCVAVKASASEFPSESSGEASRRVNEEDKATTAPTPSETETEAASRASSENGERPPRVRAGIGSIIEGRDNIKDFEALQLEEIEMNIGSRRNRIFLLLEEVRRLRVQRRLKLSVSSGAKKASGEGDVRSERPPTSIPFDSALPFLPQLSQSKLTQYYVLYACAVSAVILFGGLVAPILELRLGLGGTTYLDFIRGAHLPQQLADVDPIVASFSGGAVGVLTTLLLIEVNNAREQVKKRCVYCEGKGYLSCASCGGQGGAEGGGTCPFCSGAGKVMCPSCLCTGMTVSTEHDPRIDPWSG